MSLRIEWEKINEEHEKKAQQYLNTFFAELKMKPEFPEFLSDVTVTSLSFGTIPPYVEIVDICDPEESLFEKHKPLRRYKSQQSLSSSSSSSSFSKNIKTSKQHSTNKVLERTKLPPLPVKSVLGMSKALIEAKEAQQINEKKENSKQQQQQNNEENEKYDHTNDESLINSNDPDLDVEIKVLLEYSGDAQITLKTELIINTPYPRFICLPIVITVTHFVIKGIARIVHKKNKVLLSFNRDNESDEEGPLKDMRVYLKIGDTSKQNITAKAEKVETFITEQLKKKIVDTLVFPSSINIK